MKKLAISMIALAVAACGQQTTPETPSVTDTVSRTPVINPAENIPATRDTVHTNAVAEYSEKTENPLNDWYFSVKLFETPKTFHYLIKLQYEEMRGEDTLKLPNFGIMPEPVIQKGPEKLSCVIGFMDKDNNFREYKKVYVKDNTLKITALKHYAVSTK